MDAVFRFAFVHSAGEISTIFGMRNFQSSPLPGDDFAVSYSHVRHNRHIAYAPKSGRRASVNSLDSDIGRTRWVTYGRAHENNTYRKIKDLPLQPLAYCIAERPGPDPDQPCHLARTVVVE
jgi:hypothetical protein